MIACDNATLVEESARYVPETRKAAVASETASIAEMGVPRRLTRSSRRGSIPARAIAKTMRLVVISPRLAMAPTEITPNTEDSVASASEYTTRCVGGGKVGRGQSVRRHNVEQRKIDQQIDHRDAAYPAEQSARDRAARIFDLLAVDDHVRPAIVRADYDQHRGAEGEPAATLGRHGYSSAVCLGLGEQKHDQPEQHGALERGQHNLGEAAHPSSRGIDKAEHHQRRDAECPRAEQTAAHAQPDQEFTEHEDDDRLAGDKHR